MKRQFILSQISLALSVCYISQLSYADIQSANGNTQVTHQKGVEIVNIATPNQAGLSHNQYNKFNVDRSGAVLNNAQQNAQTQLAGTVNANPHLQKSSANIILNEVVSRTPSKLLGKQEIAGQRADYVLANPNGISCDGCGFINTPRASLVVGQPTVQSGKLTGYQVEGNKALTARGNVVAEDLDLLAPTINISGNVKAKKLNAVLGQNQFERDEQGNLSVNVLTNKHQVVDGKVAGSIQADRIRIHSTQQHSTLNVNAADLNAKQIAIIADNTHIDGQISTVRSHNLTHSTDNKKFKVTNNQTGTAQNYHKTTINAESVTLGANNRLDVNGADINSKELRLIGGTTSFGTQTTVNATRHQTDRQKGLQYRNDMTYSREETAHRTSLTADNLLIISGEGKLTAQAVKIDAKNAGIYGEQGVQFNGVKTNNRYDATVNAAGVARAKHSSSSQQGREQNYLASELNVHGDVVLGSGKDIQLTGLKAQIDGNTLLKTDHKVIINAEKTQNSHRLNDEQKLFGGVFGAKNVAANQQNVVQNGADLTVAGALLVDSDQGVNISGSRVIASKASQVKASNGNLVIDHVQNSLSSQESSRQGTLFNITKARNEKYVHTTTSQGALVKSESNLQLVGKNIDVVGSSVIADGLLDIAGLSHITVKGATNSQNQRQLDAGFNWNHKVEKPKIDLDKQSLINASINELKQVIKGEAPLLQAVNNVINATKDSLSFNAQASAGLAFHHNQQTTNNITHTAGQLTGDSVSLTANQVNVIGSQIDATQGNLNVSANSIHTLAQTDNSRISKQETQGGITDTIQATQNGITNTLHIGVTHQDTQSDTNNAKTSQLTAKQDIQLTANNIVHQGSQLNAGNDIIENAQSISHLATNNHQITNSKNVDVGATLTTAIDKSKVISGSLSVKAEGGRESIMAHTAEVTSLQAQNDIIANANKLVDHGTQYQAGNNVTLNSQQHSLTAVENSTLKDKLNAGVEAKLSANSKDLQTVNADVNVGVKFQTNSSQATEAQKATISAENVNIKTGTLTSQADISAKNNLQINAQQASFTQAQNTAQSTGGGFDLNVGAGALVIPSAGAAIPSITVGLNVNGHKQQESQSVTANLNGNNIAISTANTLNLQGTNVNGKQNVSLSADKIHLEAGHSHNHNVDVSVGGKVSLGADVSKVGLNAKLAVEHENSQTHQGTAVNANNVHLQAQNGITATGVSSQSETLNLNTGKGDLNLISATGQVNKTNFNTALNLNGGVKDQIWTPTGGSASLAVDVVRNQPQTTADLNSHTATINVGNNALLQGGSINANQATGTIKGNVHNQAVSNKINEVSVSLSASGSGKVTPYPTDNKWLESAKKDWNNGTIAGVTAEAKIEANGKRVATNSAVGINSKKNTVIINGKVTQGKAPAQIHHSSKVNINANTNLKQTLKDKKNLFTTRRM